MAANLTLSVAALLLFSCFFSVVMLVTSSDGPFSRHSLGSVKHSGPNPSGPGHKPRYAQVLDSGFLFLSKVPFIAKRNLKEILS
ncbi:hypothetical protein QYF36_005142 [Acer negundo]|nr:hypothetical protein QYF36_005142 [Acer negundo]